MHLAGAGREGVRSRKEGDLPLLLGREKEELQGNQKVETQLRESVNKVLESIINSLQNIPEKLITFQRGLKENLPFFISAICDV